MSGWHTRASPALHASTAGGTGSIPGPGPRIRHATGNEAHSEKWKTPQAVTKIRRAASNTRYSQIDKKDI